MAGACGLCLEEGGWPCASALTPPDGVENRLLHRGIPVASATRLMSELGHKHRISVLLS
jgi:hypothetical protein